MVNKSIRMSLFEVVNGYKLRKFIGLLPISFNSKVSTSVEFFTHKVHDLHVEITKQIQTSI